MCIYGLCVLSHSSHVQPPATPWTVAHQASPSMGFSRQEYWSKLSFPSPGDLPDPGIEPGSPALQADALTSDPGGKPREVPYIWSTSSLSIHLVMGLVTSTEYLRSGT